MRQRILILLSLSAVLGACQPPSGQKTTEDSTAMQADSPDITPPDSANRPANTDVAEEQIMAPDTLLDDGSIPVSWSNAGFDDPVDFKRFLVRFKEWVKTDNVDSIAAHIAFPLKKYKTPAEFKEKYPKIFDDQLKGVVAAQRLDRIFRSAEGAMIGSGEIWFANTDKGYRIIALHK